MLLKCDLACIWFTNKVLDGNFYYLGYDYIFADNTDTGMLVNPNDDKFTRYETLSRLFPLRAACDVEYFGRGGGTQISRFYCVLGSNSLTRYIFLLLWFWYGVLLILTVGTISKDIGMILNTGRLRASFLIRATGSTKVTLFYHSIF